MVECPLTVKNDLDCSGSEKQCFHHRSFSLFRNTLDYLLLISEKTMSRYLHVNYQQMTWGWFQKYSKLCSTFLSACLKKEEINHLLMCIKNSQKWFTAFSQMMKSCAMTWRNYCHMLHICLLTFPRAVLMDSFQEWKGGHFTSLSQREINILLNMRCDIIYIHFIISNIINHLWKISAFLKQATATFYNLEFLAVLSFWYFLFSPSRDVLLTVILKIAI